ncbi:MAG: hypothetical protein IPF68_14660 [Bacteroidales bacterium]|nr:hypothetical protein [Bacteroidales bacterium]
MIDRNNFHQFSPFYQVATAGLEPSAISFPLRKIFPKAGPSPYPFPMLLNVNTGDNLVQTTLGDVNMITLVVATGANTNFFGMNQSPSQLYL